MRIPALLLLAACTGAPEPEPAPAPAPVPETLVPELTVAAPSRVAVSPLTIPSTPEIASARAVLVAVVDAHTGDPANPWAVAHGMLALGADLVLDNGEPAVPYLFAEYATREEHGVAFPRKRGAIRIEPHTDLLLKAFTEGGVAPDLAVTVEGAPATPADLYRQSLARAWVDGDATGFDSWNDTPWALQGLVAWSPGDLSWTADGHAMSLDAFTSASVRKLTAETAFLRDAIAKGETVEKKKQGIFAYTCGGQHLLQGASYAVARGFGTPEDRDAVRAELGVLSWRLDLELGIVDALLREHPDYSVLLLDQRLKFLGHFLETWFKALAMELVTPEEADRAVLERAVRELVTTVGALDGLRVFEKLDDVRKADEQVYLDLVGDSAHAVRGLDLALGTGTVRY